MHQVFRFSFSVSIYEKYFCCNVEIACFILSYYCNLLEFPLAFNSNQWMYMNSCYVLCYRPILLKPTAYWSHLRNSKILIPGLSPRYSDLLGLRHSFCLSVCCFMLFWWFYCKARHVNNFSRAIKLNKARFLCLRNSKKKCFVRQMWKNVLLMLYHRIMFKTDLIWELREPPKESRAWTHLQQE